MNITMDVYDINMLFYGGITKPRKSGSMGKFELWVLLLRCPEQTLMMRFYWIERQIRWNYLDRDSRHILGETSSCCCGIVVLMIVRLSASLNASSCKGGLAGKNFRVLLGYFIRALNIVTLTTCLTTVLTTMLLFILTFSWEAGDIID